MLKLESNTVWFMIKAMLESVMLKFNCGKIERKVVSACEPARSLDILRK
jgi:hypothetical protein